jgi:hypothetical protein
LSRHCRMVVEFTTTCAIVAYHHLSWEVYSIKHSLDRICISCEVPSIADTTLGISEQYPFLCHQTGMVGHWILRLHTFYKSTHVEFFLHIIHMYISNDSNVISKYFHFVLLVVFFSEPQFNTAHVQQRTTFVNCFSSSCWI